MRTDGFDPHTLASPEALDRALAEGLALAASADAWAVAFAELDDLALPPAERPAADAASLRAVAPLYLASELEAAQVLPAVEALAGVAVSGGLPMDAGAGSDRLYRFWRRRSERFAAEERRAFFARLFGAPGPSLAGDGARAGGGANDAFPPLMLTFTEALAQAHEWRTLPTGADAALRIAAGRLADNLLERGGGYASFAARDAMTALKEALEILQDPLVQQAVGARTAWQAVRHAAERYLARPADVTAHVQRGQAGQSILAWLAEILSRLERYDLPLDVEAGPAREAAVRWLQASLDLEEHGPPYAVPSPTAPPAWR